MDSPVQLLFLGTPHIERGGMPLRGFESRKALALLAFLVGEAPAVPRSRLADLFWSEQPEERARGNLRRVLHNLATVLPGTLLIDRQTVQFRSPAGCIVDLRDFSDLVTQGTRTALLSAAALYRGPFLEGLELDESPEAEIWLLQEREQWQQRIIALLAQLTALHRDAGEWAAGLQVVERLLTLDPWNEPAHRDKMRLLVIGNQHSAALAHYEVCRRLLAAELGLTPEVATTALYEEIRSGAHTEPEASLRGFLPRSPTALRGRDAELEQITKLLAEPHCRLLTLAGPGGIGKTHLALAALAELLPRFADGAWFVDLAPISDTILLAPTIARTLALQQHDGAMTLRDLTAALRDKQLLLCLDNFEQLLAAGQDVSALLAHAPNLKLLVTSRAALNLRGEQVVQVGPLRLPDIEQLRTQSLDRAAVLLASPAGALLVERASSAMPGFAVTEETALTLAEICARLEGLPLAIELAAPHLKLFSPQGLLARLEQRLPLLTLGQRDQPPRHSTLHATIAWSEQLLTTQAQLVFARLGVFVGGWALSEAEAVAGSDLTPPEIAVALMTLVDHNLIRQQWDERGEPRFGMFETIRDFALDRLAARDDLAEVRQRHLVAFRAVAEAAAPHLAGAAQTHWIARLTAEHENLRAALEWASQAGEAAELLRLAQSLRLFWLYSGHHREARRWLELGLAMPLPSAPATRALHAEALYGAGMFANWDDDPQAIIYFDRSIALFQTLDNRPMLAQVLYELGNAYASQADFAQAEAILQQSLAIARDLGDPFLAMHATARLGICAAFQQQLSHAQPLLETTLAWMRAQGDQQFSAVLAIHLGSVLAQQGELDRAETLFHQALNAVQTTRSRLPYPLIGIAGIALYREDQERAARLLGAIDALAIPLIPAARPLHQQLVMRLRSSMDAATFQHAWQAGQHMELAALLAYARA